MRAHISNRDYEQISAYIDGQLAPGERKKLEERLRTRPELKVALEEISRTRAMIRMVPRRRAPRNFTLTPAMVGDMRPGRRRGSLTSLFPALSFASALATLVLVATLLLDLAPGLQPSSTANKQVPEVAMEPMADEQEAMRAQGEEPSQELALEAPVEEPAEMEQAAPAAQQEPAAEQGPAAEPEMSTLAEPAEMPAGKDMAANPPIIVWSDPNAPSTQLEGIGGGGGGDGGYAPIPQFQYGMGGAADVYLPEYGGLEGGMPAGGLMLPLEAAGSVQEESAREQPAPEERAAGTIINEGPILGLPSAEDAGKVEVQSGFGLPLLQGEDTPAVEPDGELPPDVPDATQGTGLTDRSPLRIVQGLLALLAIITGIAAFIVHRSRA